MKKRLKHNLFSWLIYTVMIYAMLLPMMIVGNFWIYGITIALVLGFLFGFLNDIITQLRKIQGERFKNLEE